MNVWLQDLTTMMRFLLGNPRTMVETGVIFALVVLVILYGMLFAGSALRIPNLGIVRRILAIVVGVGVLMCVWVIAQRHLVPLAKVAWLRHVLGFGVTAVAVLVVVVPVQQAIFRSAYVATLITFVATLALAALAVVLANAVSDAVQGSGEDSRTIKDRTEAMDQLLGQ
jgi:hypothetical protein